MMLAAAGFSVLSTTASAQEQVILRASNGLEIVGTSVTLEDGIYAIQTGLGQLLIDAASVECLGLLCPGLNEIEDVERPAVTLVALDGTTKISGRLQALEDGAYVLSTPLGELRLSIDDVTCEGAGCPAVSDDPRFTVLADGSALDALLPVLLQGYAEENGATMDLSDPFPDGSRVAVLKRTDGSTFAEVTLKPAGAEDVFAGLEAGDFDIGLTQRRITVEETIVLANRGITDVRDGANETLLAFDAVTVVVNPANQIRNLAPSDIARIWSGELTNWRQLGGRDLPIQIHGYETANPITSATFRDAILPANARVSAQAFELHETTQDLVASVNSSRAAIGVAPRSVAATNGSRLLSLTRQCGLLAEPSSFGIKIGDYPAVTPIYAYANPNTQQSEARDFLQWTRSAAAQIAIGDAGFANAELEKTGIEDLGMMLVHNAAAEPEFDGDQFVRVMRELRGAERLSIAFRFRTGSSILDQDSILNLGDLAQRIEDGEFENQEILLIGFADSVGASAGNTVLAGSRAEAVVEILRRELPRDVLAATSIQTLSFGEQLPMACNDEASGRERNRRVEVWTRFVSQ